MIQKGNKEFPFEEAVVLLQWGSKTRKFGVKCIVKGKKF